MEDIQIINLFFERNETALSETEKKYGKYCRTIADNLLDDSQDSEECFNDVLLSLWNSIPPNRPASFKAWIAKITRNNAINRIESRSREKRIPLRYCQELSEVENIIPDDNATEATLVPLIERFLSALPTEQRLIFVGRYFRFDSVSSIAKHLGIPENRINVTLHRLRKKLRTFLVKEGYEI